MPGKVGVREGEMERAQEGSEGEHPLPTNAFVKAASASAFVESVTSSNALGERAGAECNVWKVHSTLIFHLGSI